MSRHEIILGHFNRGHMILSNSDEDRLSPYHKPLMVALNLLMSGRREKKKRFCFLEKSVVDNLVPEIGNPTKPVA